MTILIEKLPEDSPFKLAWNSRDWPQTVEASVGVWNEIKAMRGDLWALIGNEQLPFSPVLRPSEQQVEGQKLDGMRAGHDTITAQIRG